MYVYPNVSTNLFNEEPESFNGSTAVVVLSFHQPVVTKETYFVVTQAFTLTPILSDLGMTGQWSSGFILMTMGRRKFTLLHGFSYLVISPTTKMTRYHRR
jgi:hypothetical protein